MGSSNGTAGTGCTSAPNVFNTSIFSLKKNENIFVLMYKFPMADGKR